MSRKQTQAMRCFLCSAEVSIKAPGLHLKIAAAVETGTPKFKCPLCGAFLFPKELEMDDGSGEPEFEAFRFATCPSAYRCAVAFDCYKPECESGTVTLQCIRGLVDYVDKLGKLHSELETAFYKQRG